MQNHRIYKRLDTRATVRYSIFKRPGEKSVVQRAGFPRYTVGTKNLSAGGLLFVAGEPLRTGTVLTVTIAVPDGSRTLSCLARVVRVTERRGAQALEWDTAVCFLDMTAGERALLDNVIVDK